MTEEELNALYVSLSLKSRNNIDYSFKIGHAKALGFGSIKCVSCKCYLYEFNTTKFETEIKNHNINKTLEDYENSELNCILDFNYLDNINCEIKYPEKNGEIFKWFSEYKKNNIDFNLPTIKNCIGNKEKLIISCEKIEKKFNDKHHLDKKKHNDSTKKRINNRG